MSTETSAASGADSGSLSVDSAASLLMEAEAPRPEETTAAGDAGSADQNEIPAEEPTAEEIDGAQLEGAALEGEEGEGDVEPEVPAIEAPTSWDAEAKAVFAQLPPELQTKVAEIQQQRDRQTNEALQRAAETTRGAEARAQEAGQLKAVLDQILPRAQQVFGDRWAGIDWAAWAQQDPGSAYQAEQQMRAEHAELQRLNTAKQVSDHQARQAFLQTEGDKLAEVAPELVDPQKGAATRQELKSFLNQAGFDDGTIGNATAQMLAMAHDAMRYRALKAHALQQQGKRPTPPPAKPGLRPSPRPPGNSQTRQVDQLNNRFSQTRSVDDAVALLLARG